MMAREQKHSKRQFFLKPRKVGAGFECDIGPVLGAFYLFDAKPAVVQIDGCVLQARSIVVKLCVFASIFIPSDKALSVMQDSRCLVVFGHWLSAKFNKPKIFSESVNHPGIQHVVFMLYNVKS